MKQRRIGLFGGTFNPIHNGHLHIAQAVLQALELDQILFIPSGIPPHKNAAKMLPAKDRLEMVRLALLGCPRFKPCDIEVNRPGPSYTVETVQTLQRHYQGDGLFFIIGMDAFSQIMHWEKPELLLKCCNFAILSRPDHPFARLRKDPLFKPIDQGALNQLDQGERSSYVASIMPERSLHFIKIPLSSISASDIRRRFSKGEGTKKRLPHLVESYIINHEIYRRDNNF